MGMKYKIGDRVKITSKKVSSNWNIFGEMDKWLGATMTIREVDHDYGAYKMNEDIGEFNGDGWDWDDDMIECLTNKYTKDNTIMEVSPDNRVTICYDKYNPHKKLVTAIRHEDDEFDRGFVEKLLLARMNDDKELEKKIRSEQFDTDVDWMKVAMDTPVWVSDDKVRWEKRYFCTYNPNRKEYITFSNGYNSFGSGTVVSWKYCKLAK